MHLRLGSFPENWNHPKIKTPPFSKALSWNEVVSSPQHGENTAFFSSLSVRRLYGLGALPVIPLGLEKRKRLPFPEIRPFSIVPLSTNGLSTVCPAAVPKRNSAQEPPFPMPRLRGKDTLGPFTCNRLLLHAAPQGKEHALMPAARACSGRCRPSGEGAHPAPIRYGLPAGKRGSRAYRNPPVSNGRFPHQGLFISARHLYKVPASHVAVSSPQRGGHTAFFPSFPLG